MKFDTLKLLDGQVIRGLAVESGTEVARLAKSGMNGGELFNQTDETTGVYTYNDGAWEQVTSDINVALSGLSASVFTSIVSNLIIENYNFQSTYSVAVSGGGAAVRTDEAIEYTSRGTAGTDVLTVTRDGVDTVFTITVSVIPVVENNIQYYLPNISGSSVAQGVVTVGTDGEYFVNDFTESVHRRSKLGIDVWFKNITFTILNHSIVTDETDAYVLSRGAAAGGVQPMITKLDGTDGSYIWDTSFDTSADGSLGALHAGIYDGTNIVCVGLDFNANASPKKQWFMTKVNTSGAVQWQQSFGDPTDTDLWDVQDIVQLGTDYYVCGRHFDGTRNGLLAKFDSDGTLVWSKLLPEIDQGWESVCTDGTDIYVCGEDRSSPRVPIWAKYDTSGTLVYQRKLETGNRGGLHASAFYNGNVYFCGNTQDLANLDEKGLLLKITPSTGVVTLSRQITFDADPADDKTTFETMEFDSNGNMYLAGEARSDNIASSRSLIVLNDDQGVSMTGTATDPEITFDTTLLVDEAASLVDTAGVGSVTTTTYVPDTSVSRDVNTPSYTNNNLATY